MNVFLVPINYLAILACGIGTMVVGYFWYGPIFGKQWSQLSGMTPQKTAAAKKEMPKTYTLMFISSLVMAYVLAHFIWYAAPGSLTLLIAVKTAVWAWLGFIATYALTKFLFSPEKKSFNLYFLDLGYYLVVLVLMGIILFVIR